MRPRTWPGRSAPRTAARPADDRGDHRGRARPDLAAIVATVDPDVVQLNGREPVSLAASIGRRSWKVLHLPAEPRRRALRGGPARVGAVPTSPAASSASSSTPPAGPTRAAPARASVNLAAAVAREVPVTLAGGLAPANVAGALRDIPATGVDVASGVELPREPGERPRKDPFLVALFAKRARAARDDRPNLAFGPTPVHAGLLEADLPAVGGWSATSAAATCPRRSWRRSSSWSTPTTPSARTRSSGPSCASCWGRSPDDRRRSTVPTGWPRPCAPRQPGSRRPAAAGAARPRQIPGLRLYLKREDLAHTGAHKINNALGQSLLTRRLGKSRVIAETGAGQHGVATATACALLDLPCVVYMGAEDIERQGPNVLRMRALGAEVRSVTSGTATLKDAVNEAMRDWVTNVETTHYVLGSAMGPHPYPTIVRDLQRRIGDEAAAQLRAVEGRLPDAASPASAAARTPSGCSRGSSASRPSASRSSRRRATASRPGGHAAAILGGTPGILHGSRSLMLQDRDGQVVEAHSASAGLDYPGIGPQLAALAEGGRIEVASATDREAVAAMKTTTRTEGILPALETAHAIAAIPKLLAGDGGSGDPWPDEILALVGFSGRGDKDLAALERFADVEPWAGEG